jgi:hypothetical protein
MTDRICSLPDCGKREKARQLCSNHYNRAMADGTLRLLSESGEERFWARLDKSGECWLWTGCLTPEGYGRATFRSVSILTHRLAYLLAFGELPSAGLGLDHDCHNRDLTCMGGPTCLHRRCVNPAHLVPRTHAENMRASHVVMRSHCIHDHEFTPENTRMDPRTGVRHCKTCHRNRARDRHRRLAREKAAR